jgi:3-hydroxyacyl-[acyl-carrier-protein] dehydratase
MDHQQLLKTFRKKLLSDCSTSLISCDYGLDDIKKIIPHREPFLLIDHISGIDLANEIICGSKNCPADDPVFAGHFPGFPAYPGTLQAEAAGQMGICLCYFLTERTTTIPSQQKTLRIRATKLLGAHFLEPVVPGSLMKLVSRRLQADAYFETYIGQVIVDQKICSIGIGEICIL